MHTNTPGIRSARFEPLHPRAVLALSAFLAVGAAALCLFTSAAVASQPASEVLVRELSEDEWLTRQARQGDQLPSESSAMAVRAPTPNSRWFIPRFSVDNGFFRDETTFYSVRNEAAERAAVTARYFNRQGVLIVSETFELDIKEVMSRNLRDVPGLLGVFDTEVQGYVEIEALALTMPFALLLPITVDYFLVDSANDFANGGPAFVERCRRWSSRFVNFGDGPSKLDFYVRVPGSAPSDPIILPAAQIGVYSETGSFTRAFEVITDAQTFTVDLDPLLDGSFGVVEIDFGALVGGDNTGLVSARHSALGRFSVSGSGVCLDPAP